YAIIGNTRTAALVGRDGSIDWLPLPRFDSGACFAALVGTDDNGRWLIAPEGEVRAVERHYRGDTLILETRFTTAAGTAVVTDFMHMSARSLSQPGPTELIRLVKGERGSMRMRLEFVLRFDYGCIVPWVRSRSDGIYAIAGPDAVRLRTPIALTGQGKRTVADFTVAAGETVPFVLTHQSPFAPEPPALDPARALDETEAYWREWSAQYQEPGEWRDAVLRSLITLKALTYSPTGGIVAAPTTSLPEAIGGVRNWDYRYCWLRDAMFTLYALLISGYREEAKAWREWLLRAVAGEPSTLQILYGLAGERRITEYEIPWLAGHAGSRPVRIGNLAHEQHQWDVYGEIMDVLNLAREHGLEHDDNAWRVQSELLDFLEAHWQLPDSGIWEMRGEPRRFTHSAMMAWVAVDRAVKALESIRGLDGPLERWRKLAADIHEEVCRRGFDAERGAFVQYYGSKELDAALLLMPMVGFLPVDDPRIVTTVQAIERELTIDGLVLRYRNREHVEGLPPGEGVFLACSFWLADVLVMMGRRDQAVALFERLLALRNDVGLLAEEFDPRAGRALGNFPQAFSHVGVINTAHNLTLPSGPAERRASSQSTPESGRPCG
ncbi:MAG TPA: glycoside hydrolase family 15 protein, partial [Stellaceae bacterium]|nr:glycoside hydrolase family 15 protein [Stellaceae bacterium]